MLLLLCWLLAFMLCAVEVEVVDVMTEEDLRTMSTNLNGFYRLKNDIVLTQPWTPVSSFTGVLDGQGKSIRNITFDSAELTGNVGFFAQLNMAQIYDVTFVANASITMANPSGKSDTGAGIVAGSVIDTVFYLVRVEGSFSVTSLGNNKDARLFIGGAVGDYKCNTVAGAGLYSNVNLTTTTIFVKYFAVGGTIGRVQGGCTFTDLAVGSQSIVDATVTQAVTNLTVGGLVGVVYQNAVFRYSVASAALVKGKVISGSAFVGGAVGLCQAIQHIDSTTSNVSCSATETSKCYVGGVVGGIVNHDNTPTESVRLRSLSSSSVVYCSSDATSACHTGGVAGIVNRMTINDCVSYASPTVVGKGHVAAGGLVGTLSAGRIIGGRVYLDTIAIADTSDTTEIHLGGLVGDAMRGGSDSFVSIGNSYVRIHTLKVYTKNSAKVGGIVGAHRTVSNTVNEMGGEIHDCCAVLNNVDVMSDKALNTELEHVVAVGGVAGSLVYVSMRNTYVTYKTIAVKTHGITAGIGGIQGISINSRLGTVFAVGENIVYSKAVEGSSDKVGDVYIGGGSGYTKFSTVRHTYSDTSSIGATITNCRYASIGGFTGFSNTSRHYLSYSIANKISVSRNLGSYNVGGFIGFTTVGVGTFDSDKTWSYANIHVKCQDGVTCLAEESCNVGGYAGRISNLMDIRYSYAEGTLASSDATCGVGLFVGAQSSSIAKHSMATLSFSGTAKSGSTITWYGGLSTSKTRPTPCTGCLYATDFAGVMSLADPSLSNVFDKAFAAQGIVQNFTLSELCKVDTYGQESLGSSGYFKFSPSSNWYMDEGRLPFLSPMPYRAARLSNVQGADVSIQLFNDCNLEFCWSSDAASVVKGTWKVDSAFRNRPVFDILMEACTSWSLCSSRKSTPDSFSCKDNATGQFCNVCTKDSFCKHGGQCKRGLCSCQNGLGGSDCSVQYCRMNDAGMCGGPLNTCLSISGDQYTCMCNNGFTKFDGICIRSPAALSAEPKDGVLVVNRIESRRAAPVNIAFTSIFAILLVGAVAALIFFLLRIYVCKSGTGRMKSSSLGKSTSNMSLSRSTSHFGNASADNISLMAA
ncbi:hypothetical protein GL50803_0013922 [Giardia duodenalis]|uniref:Uncharacterized protein n=1 Tax=Giardia intestinalis (strain ATCC 50803 / WB clone C6) TaxID=184922 RepID=A8BRW1_GIAIC|nr:hypothetical protein GL50803_0013922 [Giardia intestinalis]KAE8304476.1 hypothetical protein GL50803_0013922 [Giardia intestinalis]|eukprot:XP_001705212.1 Hypothetical protein GL50803_13922 [Giardia lamblia ATCC 50803]